MTTSTTSSTTTGEDGAAVKSAVGQDAVVAVTPTTALTTTGTCDDTATTAVPSTTEVTESTTRTATATPPLPPNTKSNDSDRKKVADANANDDQHERVAPTRMPSLQSTDGRSCMTKPGMAATSTGHFHHRLRECLTGHDHTDRNQQQSKDNNDGREEDDNAVISLPRLRKLASQGLPDEDDDHDMTDTSQRNYNATSYRGLTWRILLGYLPPERKDWDSILHEKRTNYQSFVREWFQNTYDACTVEGGDELRRKVQSPIRPVRVRSSNQNGTNRGQQQQQQQPHADGVDDSETTTTTIEDNHFNNDDTNFVLHGNDSNLSEASSSSYDPTANMVPFSSSSASPSTKEQRKAAAAAARAHSVNNIPPIITELWKKRGRDRHVLEDLLAPRNPRDMNALRWNEDHVNESIRLQKQQLQQQLEQDDISLSNRKPQPGEDTATVDPLSDLLESAVLLDEIRKDVIRTHPDLSFYLHPAIGKRRYAVLERILFVWSKYNRGVRYVQGMNEIVATIYYVLATDACQAWAVHAEADTYWLLHILLTEMRDVFVPDLDDADTGIQGRIANMQELLSKHDPEVKEHLEEIGIDASFYAIRWWTTLLSREFLLPDVIRLWDSLFASTHKDNFLRYVCVTMVLLIRNDLLKGDFSTCLRLLQSYPSTHMDRLLESSRALWVYESQITVACHKGGISLHQAVQMIAPPHALVMAFGLRNKNGSLVSMVDHPGSTNSIGSASGGYPNREQLEQASARASEKMRDAKQAVAASASSLFGRARGLYSRYSKEISKQRHNRAAGGTLSDDSSAGTLSPQSVKVVAMERGQSKSPGKTNSPTTVGIGDPSLSLPPAPEEDVYLQAFLKNSPPKTSAEKKRPTETDTTATTVG